jgi:predicted Fe-S protein YdhL (DUF1289 family)
MRIESVANKREHWSRRAKRAKDQRELARWSLSIAGVRPSPPLTIRITRIAPRNLDSDNLSSGCKALRDGIADWLGVDDGDNRLTWVYAQERGQPRQYLVRVEFEALAHCGRSAQA